MITKNSKNAAISAPDPLVTSVLRRVRKDALLHTVEALAWPRHFLAQPHAKRRAGEWLHGSLEAMGWQVQTHGPWRNVIGWSGKQAPSLIFGAHYDSYVHGPGTD